jgi:hypothetical protein
LEHSLRKVFADLFSPPSVWICSHSKASPENIRQPKSYSLFIAHISEL